MFWDLQCLVQHAWGCPFFSVVSEVRHKTEKRELLGGTKEISVSLQFFYLLPSPHIGLLVTPLQLIVIFL